MLPGYSYLSITIEKIGLKDPQDYIDPAITVTVKSEQLHTPHSHTVLALLFDCVVTVTIIAAFPPSIHNDLISIFNPNLLRSHNQHECMLLLYVRKCSTILLQLHIMYTRMYV